MLELYRNRLRIFPEACFIYNIENQTIIELLKKLFLFHSDTNFNGGNKTPTPSPKGFFGQSSSFPIGRAYSPQKGCLIYSMPLEGCLRI